MSSRPAYVVDTSIFLQAANLYYAFDIAPAFWNALTEQAQNGRLLTIDHVRAEIERKNDNISNWVKQTFYNWCNPTNEEDVINSYREIIKWVQGQDQFYTKAIADFAGGADGWVIAYAKAKKYVVATEEKFHPNINRTVPIPNVCRAFDIPCIDTFALLRNLGVKFY